MRVAAVRRSQLRRVVGVPQVAGQLRAGALPSGATVSRRRCEPSTVLGSSTCSAGVSWPTTSSRGARVKVRLVARLVRPPSARGRCQRSRSGANPASSAPIRSAAAAPWLRATAARSTSVSTRPAAHAPRQSPASRRSVHSVIMRDGTA
ncbi:hypothetical protein ACFQZ4_39545 [Catellatospora coxensis]